MDGFLLEAGTDRLLLEDGSGVYGQEWLVGISTGTSGVGTTSADPSAVLPAGVQDNDLGIFLVSSAATAFTPTDPSGWSLDANGAQVVGTTLWSRVWTKTLTAAEAGTAVTATMGASKWTAVLLVIRGGVVDTSVASTGTASTSLSIPAVTPTANDDLLIQLSGIRLTTATDPSHTPAGGWTEYADVVGGASPVNSAAVSTLQLVGQSGVAQGPWTATIATGQNATFTVAVKAGAPTGPVYDSAGAWIVGDSLIDNPGEASVETAWTAAGGDAAELDVDGEGGRKISNAGTNGATPTTLEVIDGWRGGGRDVRTQGYPLGANNRDKPGAGIPSGANYYTEAEQLVEWDDLFAKIAEEDGPYVVHLFGQTFPAEATDEVQAIATSKSVLAQVCAEYDGVAPFDQVVWHDWDAYLNVAVADEHSPELWNADDVHMTTAGYNLRTAYIVSRMLADIDAITTPARATARATATTAATHPATGSARATATATATAVGTHTVAPSARATATATATRTAQHTVTVTARATATATATATGTRPATGTGRALAAASGATTGTHPASGSGRATAAATATRTGTHTVAPSARAVAAATATSTATHTVAATGRAVAVGTATAAGVRTGTGIGRATATATAVSGATRSTTSTGRATAAASVASGATHPATGTGRAVASASGVSDVSETHSTSGTGRAVAAAAATSTGARPGTGNGRAVAAGSATVATVHLVTPTGRAVAVAAASTLTDRLTLGTAPARALATGEHQTTRISAGTGRAVATARGAVAGPLRELTSSGLRDRYTPGRLADRYTVGGLR